VVEDYKLKKLVTVKVILYTSLKLRGRTTELLRFYVLHGMLYQCFLSNKIRDPKDFGRHIIANVKRLNRDRGDHLRGCKDPGHHGCVDKRPEVNLSGEEKEKG
jgi:hypothetical protein